MSKPQSETHHPKAVALFGGSFNPPHMGHVMVAAWALAGGEVEEVWAVPTGGHPFGKPLTPFEHRLEMCRRAFLFSPRVRVLDAEREDRVHFTVETIARLSAEFPGCRWRWLMGSDTLADAPQWKDFAEIERLAPPLIIPRAGHGPGAGPAGAFALPDVSSTVIRERLAESVNTAELKQVIPGSVLEYIVRRRLFQANPQPGDS